MLSCGAVCGEGRRGINNASSSLGRLSVNSPATLKKIALSGANSMLSGLVYILGSHGTVPCTVL